MSRQDNESRTVTYNLSGGHGGKEVPTVIFTNKLVNQGHGLKEVLEKWLESPPDTRDIQHELRGLHHEGTGRWLLDDVRFVEWKATPSALWITGISGTGKSVLSSTVIAEIVKACPARSAVAFFYFDFRNERQHMDLMLRSIIWQLSGRSPLPYSSLDRLYKTLGNGTIQPQRGHLQGVLEDLLSELDRTYIVIDGLNECKKTDWRLLIEFIHSLCHPTKNAPHLLFTSQPLEEFQAAFKDITFIELGSVVSNDDISSFVSSTVCEVRNWASDDEYAKLVTEQIVQKSNGMFRMATCLLIELDRCYMDEWQETLAALPVGLFRIYNCFFTWAADTAPTRMVFVEAIFRWLVFSTRQLTLDELTDAIAFHLDDPAFDLYDPAKSIYYPKRHQGHSDIFNLLEGLIVIKDNDQDETSITLAHSSVKDFLLSPHFQRQFGSIIDLTKDVSHKFIAQTCVRYLLLFADPKHSITKDTLPDYPISLYAAEYWYYHLQLCNDQDQKALLPLTMRLLEDGSSQYAALYKLRPLPGYMTRVWDAPIPPAVWMSYTMGYTQVFHSLLIKHNTCIDMAIKDSCTALHLASEKGRLNFAKLLIQHNTSVNVATKDGWTALHFGSEEGDFDVAQLLIKHNADVDQASKNGWTALHFALRRGHLNIARLLIEHNASVDLATKDGKTSLHLASEKGHFDIARLLIENNASVDPATKDGKTALHLASEKGHLNIARLLIEHNASVGLATKDGKTALHLASEKGHLDIARLLIEHNASVDPASKDGKTVLHLALKQGHLSEPAIVPVTITRTSISLSTSPPFTSLVLLPSMPRSFLPSTMAFKWLHILALIDKMPHLMEDKRESEVD